MRLRKMVDEGNKFRNYYFRQMVDLDMSEVGPWTAMGRMSTSFSGTYDGNNHRIENLTLANSTGGGLFGYVSYAEIKDLTVHFAGFEKRVSTPGGAIATHAYPHVQFIHVIAEGEFSNVGSPSAGIAIWAYRAKMIGCTNRVNISGTVSSGIGGLAAECGEYRSNYDYEGLTCQDCANEGRIENTSYLGTAGGLVGRVVNKHNLSLIRCQNVGEIQAPNPGSFIGEYVPSAATIVTASDCVAQVALPPIARILEGPRMLTGLNFATVSSDLAYFCDVPSTAGAYKVMLQNDNPILLAGVKPADRLELADFEKYSGTVTCVDEGLSVKGVDGIWTVSKRMSVDWGNLVEGPEPGFFELQPAANQVEVTVDGFDGEQLKIPGTIEFVRGIDPARLVVANAQHDVTGAVLFDGDAENGYVLSLDGDAVVKGVKVRPTIGEGVTEAFTVVGGAKIEIKSVPGLWYGLFRGETPYEIEKLCDVKMAEAGTLTLRDALPWVPSVFYKVKVYLSNPDHD